VILRPHLLKDTEYFRKSFTILLERGTTLDDVLKPTYWVNVGMRLKPLQQIFVHPDDGTWYAELIVRSATPRSARVSVVHHKEFTDPLAEELADFEIKHRGGAGWSAIRRSDKTVVVERLPSKEAVHDWLKNPLPAAQAA
jgi:hypothetical protein